MSAVQEGDAAVRTAHPPATPVAIAILVPRVFLALMALIALLAIAFVATHWLNLQGYSGQFGFRRLFNMDGEGNLPTWFSSALLLAASLLLGVIALAKTRLRDAFRWHWCGLVLGFAWLSADETAQLHEMLNRPAHALPFDAAGGLAFPWIVLAVPVVVGLAIVYGKFLKALPPLVRLRFVVAAACFLGGSIGFEPFEAALADAQGLTAQADGWTQEGRFGLGYMALVMGEECLEMTGVALFIRALLLYIDTQFARLTISVID